MTFVKNITSLFYKVQNYNNVHDGDNYITIAGTAEGTSYHIIYHDNAKRCLKDKIDSLLNNFEKSLSVYDPESTISRINRNETNLGDAYLLAVIKRAKVISKLTKGTFDISAEPLFRAWGFSAQKKSIPNESEIKELKERIGMDKIQIKGQQIIKKNPEIVINGNAIAKGYSADIVAEFFRKRGIVNYLIEIGGEIRTKGKNKDSEAWRIGIDRPKDGNYMPGEDIQVILQLTDKALATSGNYRQFYLHNGQKISHTIHPKTGYPVSHNLLSATVLADDAMTADAFATAFMVMGEKEAIDFIQQTKGIEAIFICSSGQQYTISYSTGFEKYICKTIE